MAADLTGPLASVFTPSYNKGALAVEAVQSVLSQDTEDFEYWILENSDDGGATRALLAPHMGDPRVIYEEIEFTPQERSGPYPTAVLLNRYYAKANGRYIFYLSDDDLFGPSCVRQVCEFLEEDELRAVCWFTLRHQQLGAAGTYYYTGTGIVAHSRLGAGTPVHSVDNRIDGGQIAHRKACLDFIPQPWFPETTDPDEARHADGIFLDKLAAHWTFWPLNEHLVTHRRTPLSTWDRLRT